MKVAVDYDGPIPAPIAKGTKLAKVVITAPDMPPIEIPVVAGADVGRLGFRGRIVTALKYVVWGPAK